MTEIQQPDPHFLTVTEAAKIARMKPMLLYRYIWEKKGPRLVRFGRRIKIRRDDFLEWCSKDHPSPKTPKG